MTESTLSESESSLEAPCIQKALKVLKEMTFTEEEWAFYRERLKLLVQGMLKSGLDESYVMESLRLTQEQLNNYKN